MPTIIERDVRPVKIALELPTCQRRRDAPPNPHTVLSMALEEGEELRRPLGRLRDGRPVPGSSRAGGSGPATGVLR